MQRIISNKRRQFLAASMSLIVATGFVPNAVFAQTDKVDTTENTAQAEPTETRPLTIADMLAWEGIKAHEMSNDGKWLALKFGPAEGNAELIVKQISGHKEYTFPLGHAGRGNSIYFSENSRWLAFGINPNYQPAGSKSSQPTGKIGLVDLTNGELKEFDNIQNFEFSGDKVTWLALHKRPATSSKGRPGSTNKKSPPPRGRDLVLYNLNSDLVVNIGNASEYKFDAQGEKIAWIVDSKDQSGNGIYVRNLKTDVQRVVDSGEARYSRLSWARKEEAITALKGEVHDDYQDMLYSVLGVKNPGDKKPKKVVFNPLNNKDFPDSFSISPKRTPYWNENLSTLVFGIAEVEKTAAAKARDDKTKNKQALAKQPKVSKSEKPEVVIWHWQDVKPQVQQQKEARRDRDFSYLASYRIADKTFIRHTDESMKFSKTPLNHKWGIGYDIRKYQLHNSLIGKSRSDIYRINLKTGEKTLAVEEARWRANLSPLGKYALYFQNGHYHTLELATGKKRNITADVNTSFINVEDDHNVIDPPHSPFGWVKGDKSVLLYDGWDIWQVNVKGGEGKNLTKNGKQKQWRYYELFNYDEDAEHHGIDLSKDTYVRIRSEWTKEAGFGRLKNGVEVLRLAKAVISAPEKAKNADVYVYRQQTPQDSVAFYRTDKSFKQSQRLTEASKQQAEIAWGSGVRLVDFTTDKGVKLQASLHLPANYEEGKAYPTIVYIYEKISDKAYQYMKPDVAGFNTALYTSNGYAVLKPDIVYEIDNPGMSAVWAVLPAVKAAVATGIVDEKRVGLTGHSWGGYQSSFIATQSDAFAAIFAGAPVTNMVSMYGVHYWNNGISNASIFETRQGRFSSHYIDQRDAYIRNSPILFADKVNTPLVILHNDKDGAVDFTQGVEYYNILRRLGKEVVMLQYVGENHSVTKPANRKDYTRRMMEFFDHQLKDKNAPDWWQDGVPHLDNSAHVEKRVAELKQQVRDLSDQKKQAEKARDKANGKGAKKTAKLAASI